MRYRDKMEQITAVPKMKYTLMVKNILLILKINAEPVICIKNIEKHATDMLASYMLLLK